MARSLSRASSREGSITGRGPGPEFVAGLLGLLKAGRGGTEEEEDGGGEAETGRGEGGFGRLGTLLVVSRGLESWGSVCEGETRSAGGLGDLWSRTVFTEVRDGVVTVLDGLGLYRTRPCVGASRFWGWEASRSVSLTAEREETGLWGGTRFWFWSAPSSSMCSTRPAGNEKRGEVGVWDSARKEGVVEEGTGGRGVLEEEESPAGSSREPREVGYRTDMQRRRGQKA